MANISHFTQTVNGVSTTYDIHDANAIPRSGGSVITSNTFSRTVNDSSIGINGGNGWDNGANITVYGKDNSAFPGKCLIHAADGTNEAHFWINPNGTASLNSKNLAMQEDTVPRTGGSVLTGSAFSRTVDNSELRLDGGSDWNKGGSIVVNGQNNSTSAGTVYFHAYDGTNEAHFWINPNGTASLNSKNLAMQEDTVPRTGGAVISGNTLGRTVNNSYFFIEGGTDNTDGGLVALYGKNYNNENAGGIFLGCRGSSDKAMILLPSGTWAWNGTACQITSDQRYKQQIDAIDDKLLDAWADVAPVQFKYNDAVDQKGKDKARLHTGYVVQQIQKACENHGVDISAYGLFCHEEYPQETEEVEVEQADGTKTKERKVIREASEHYSLRYTEALIVECKYLRQCIERLTARIEELEKRNKEEQK